MVYALIKTIDPIPPGLGFSYGDLQFARYGVCAWEYNLGYRGPVHFINWKDSVIENEFPNPIGFWYYLFPGLTAVIGFRTSLPDTVPDIEIGGQKVNFTTGEGVLIPP